MSTLPDQSIANTVSYTTAMILSTYNIPFPFFRLEQDIVTQGIFEAIKFRESPKMPKICNFCGI